MKPAYPVCSCLVCLSERTPVNNTDAYCWDHLGGARSGPLSVHVRSSEIALPGWSRTIYFRGELFQIRIVSCRSQKRPHLVMDILVILLLHRNGCRIFYCRVRWRIYWLLWRCDNNLFVSIRVGWSEFEMAVYAAGFDICSTLITHRNNRIDYCSILGASCSHERLRLLWLYLMLPDLHPNRV